MSLPALTQTHEIAEQALRKATQTAAELDKHDAVCALRYSSLEKQGVDFIARMDRLEKIMLGATAIMITSMIGIIVSLAFRH